jgi:cytochrome c553
VGLKRGKLWRLPAFGPAVVFWLLLIAPASAQMSIEERIEQCVACHGEGGNSVTEGIPSLAGQPRFFLLNQLFLMREGVRQIEAMEPFVKDLTDPDMEALATYFSKLEPKRSDEAVDPKLVKRGAELSARLRCGSCHRPDMSGQEQMPRLAKQRIDYMIEALKAFRDNKRSGADTLMSAAVYGVSDADLEALAHYAASR